MDETIDGLNASYDAVVVGARCAGASTAMLLARAGLSVLVVEQGRRDTDTLSTLALMRCGTLQLARWGLLDAIKAAGTPPVTTTTFYYDEEAVEVQIKARGLVDALYAPRRTLLDPVLADAARASGAQVVYGTRLKVLQRDSDGRVNGVIVERGGVARAVAATIVIGADGANSTVAKEVGAAPYRVGAHMTSTIYTFVRGIDRQGYHWHYVRGASIGVIPTNAGDTLIFASVTPQRFGDDLRRNLEAGFHTIVRETSPAVAAALAGASCGPFHRFAGRPASLRRAWGPGWALVGDAGFFKDPITAHGITDALRDAELLARAVVGGTTADLVNYQTTRDELSVPLMMITDEIASLAWDMPRLKTLHKSLSDEMSREVLHVIDRWAEGVPFGDVHDRARPHVQRDDRGLQPVAR